MILRFLFVSCLMLWISCAPELSESERIEQLQIIKDYDQGMQLAREKNKPVFLYFTGYACVNAIRLEDILFNHRQCYNLIQKEFIKVWLYVDDRKELPEAERKRVKVGDKVQFQKNYGNKWLNLEVNKFQQNTQPLLAILDTTGQAVHSPMAYTTDPEEVLKWLEKGLALFNK